MKARTQFIPPCLLLLIALFAGVPIAPAGEIIQQAYLKASNTDKGDWFGHSVAISGDTAVVGARSEDSAGRGIDNLPDDNSASNSGAAYVFVRDSSGNWTQQAYLKASNSGTSYDFGSSVAISGDTIVVGSKYKNSSATGVNGNQNNEDAENSGAAYVFARDPSNGEWSQQAYLKASNTDAGDNFGSSVAVSGSWVAVGAPNEDSATDTINGDDSDNTGFNTGAVYVFRRQGSTWSHHSYIKAPNPGDSDQFGTSVALSAGTLAVGAPGEAGGSGIGGPYNDDATNAGAVYVFKREFFTPLIPIWTFEEYLKSSNANEFLSLGRSVSISGDTLIAGADNPLGSEQGAAYIFKRAPGPTWSKDHRLTGYDGTSNFGAAVSVSNDRAIVGAPFESVDFRPFVGQAYVADEIEFTWKSRFPMMASNYDGDDAFGSAVAIDGRTIIVGAPGESSAATAINGDHEDDSANNAGAAYIFYEMDPPITITGFTRRGSLVTLDFISEAGIPDGQWRVRGSGDLNEFDIDHTGTSIIGEITNGVYQALVNIGGAGDRYFLRIERIAE